VAQVAIPQAEKAGRPGAEEEHPQFLTKELCMAQNAPKKAGEYERPMTGTSSSMAVLIGIIAVLAVIVIAVLFLR
jgi:LPXTG-motif cell wall-anchored protein